MSKHDGCNILNAQAIHDYLDNLGEVLPSLSDEEIEIAQKWDPELCRFMELLHEH